MGDNDRKYTISERVKNREFKVTFTSIDEAHNAICDLEYLILAQDLYPTIKRLRNLCTTQNQEVYYPKSDIDLPKARWIMVTAAASYPRGIPISLVLDSIEITQAQLNAYCTSKNNPTSKYLHTDGGLIYISLDGIDWLIELLEKDKQIEKVEKSS